MRKLLQLRREEGGAAAIEFAFALPVMIVMIYMIFQLGLVYRANSGIQHSLGQGARQATLWPTPTPAAVRTKMLESVYGIGPGTFTIPPVVIGTADGSTYWELQVTYTQKTKLLLFPGPNITVTKSKRVWVAS